MKLKIVAFSAVGFLALIGSAEAFPAIDQISGAGMPVETVQYGGPRCFYPDGWHGPGFYRCGFRFRRGLGFIGPRGGAVVHGSRGGFGGRGGRGGGAVHFGGRGGGHAGGGGHGGGGRHR